MGAVWLECHGHWFTFAFHDGYTGSTATLASAKVSISRNFRLHIFMVNKTRCCVTHIPNSSIRNLMVRWQTCKLGMAKQIIFLKLRLRSFRYSIFAQSKRGWTTAKLTPYQRPESTYPLNEGIMINANISFAGFPSVMSFLYSSRASSWTSPCS